MKDIRLIFIGDSFVNGTGDETFLGWSGRVSQLFNDDETEVTSYSLGVRRETSSDILKRWEQEVQTRLMKEATNIGFFSFGVNDCVEIEGVQRVSFEQSIKNITTILSEAKKQFDQIVFVMAPPIDDELVNKRIAYLNTQYHKVCIDLEIDAIDVFDALKLSSIWTDEVKNNDGAHPKSGGYGVFAHLLEQSGIKSLVLTKVGI
jgi:lysophospholipase L1-like esterase